MGSRIGDLLRELAVAYEDLETNTQDRFEYLEEELHTNNKKINKIRFGLQSIVENLKDEGDTEYDFNQK